MRAITTAIILLIISLPALSRTTYEQIRANKPNISSSYARRLAKAFDKLADKYKVPANVLAAIAMVESSYMLKAINKRSNDFGIMQINKYNIRAYRFSRNRLLTDLEYSIEAGFIVFKWFYKTYDTLEEAVKRYNGGTARGVTKWRGPRRYWKKVLTYM